MIMQNIKIVFACVLMLPLIFSATGCRNTSTSGIHPEQVRYAERLWFTFAFLDGEEDRRVGWFPQRELSQNPNLYSELRFVRNESYVPPGTGTIVYTWPVDNLRMQIKLARINIAVQLATEEYRFYDFSLNLDTPPVTMDYIVETYNIEVPIAIANLVDNHEGMAAFINKVQILNSPRVFWPIYEFNHPYRSIPPITPNQSGLLSEQRLLLLSKFNYAAKLHFEFSYGTAAEVRALLDATESNNLHAPSITEIIFVRNEAEADALPSHTIAAWPRAGIFSKNLADLLNLVLTQDEEDIPSRHTSGISIEDFNLTYPIMVPDLINNWEDVLELWNTLTPWERDIILNLSSSPTRIPAHRLYN